MKAVSFGFGRMNPPTQAHQLVVDAISRQEAEPRLYLSHSQDPIKNPLDYDKKIYWVDQSFGDRVNVISSEARNMYEVMAELYNEGFTDVIYVCGSDRVEEAKRLTGFNGTIIDRNTGRKGKLTGDGKYINSKGDIVYRFNSVKIVQAGNDRINEDDIPTEYISASLQRKFVQQGDLESFVKYCPERLNDEQREQLFYDVKSGMQLSESIITEASMSTDDIVKDYPRDRYLQRVIDDLPNGVKLIDGTQATIEDPEKIKSLSDLLQVTDKNERVNKFNDISGFNWRRIDKSVYSGKGGSHGQSAGQHLEPIICDCYNRPESLAEIISTNFGDDKNLLFLFERAISVLNSRWSSSWYVAVHIDGDDITQIGQEYKDFGRIYKSEKYAAEILKINPTIFKGLYVGGKKDNWNKGDILLVRKGLLVSQAFNGVTDMAGFNKRVQQLVDENDGLVIPISIKKFLEKYNPDPKLYLFSKTDEFEFGQVYIRMPKMKLDHTHSGSCYLVDNNTNTEIQFRSKYSDKSSLSIEAVAKAYREGKGLTQIYDDLRITDAILDQIQIESNEDLYRQLEEIAPIDSRDLRQADQLDEVPPYQRVCFKGLIGIYKEYQKKYGGDAKDLMAWMYGLCTRSTTKFYILK